MSESRNSSNQKAAIITLVVTTLSGLALLYVNMTTPGGASVDEIILLGTVTVILTALVPLYLAKVSWSWAAGIVTFLGLYLFAAITVLEASLHGLTHVIFSLAIYNVAVFAIYAVATVGIFFSFRSLKEQPPSLPEPPRALFHCMLPSESVLTRSRARESIMILCVLR